VVVDRRWLGCPEYCERSASGFTLARNGRTALIGYPDVIVQAPLFSTPTLAVILTVPMAGWIRFRHHGWRPSLEMGSARMGLGIVLVALGALGLLPVGEMFEWVALASGIVGVAVHSLGYWRLERDQGPMPQEGEEPGDTESQPPRM
jgi:hypothetical protein